MRKLIMLALGLQLTGCRSNIEVAVLKGKQGSAQLTISPAELQLKVGESVDFEGTLTSKDQSHDVSTNLSFQSNDTSVATLEKSSSGIIKLLAKAVGTSTLTYDLPTIESVTHEAMRGYLTATVSAGDTGNGGSEGDGAGSGGGGSGESGGGGSGGGSTTTLPAPTALSFTDTDTDGGQVAGNILVTIPTSETGITSYKLYWGTGTSTKRSKAAFATVTPTGSNLSYALAANTNLPTTPSPTHILAYSFDGTSESTTPAAVALSDVSTAGAQPVTLNFIPPQNALYETAGSTHTFTATAFGASTLVYSISSAPANTAIDSSTGVFTWTLPSVTNGTVYTFTVRVEDQADATRFDEQVVTAIVRNLRSSPTITFSSGILTVTGNSAPDHFEITISGGVISYKGTTATITGGGGGTTISAASVSEIRYLPGGGSDVLIMHDTCGDTKKIVATMGSGTDYVFSGCGDDVIQTQAGGNEYVDAGGGDDTITVGTDPGDIAYGGAGNDTINGGASAATLYGGAGNDTINGQAGDDIIYAEDGNDSVNPGTGADTVYLGIGDDTTTSIETSDLLLDCGAGTDTVPTGSLDLVIDHLSCQP